MDRNTLFYRLAPMAISLMLMASMVLFYLSEGPFVQSLRDRLGWVIYDLRMSATLQNQQIDATSLPVTIVDIDEASLAKLGHWPWPKDHLTQLTAALVDQGAILVAYDVLFAEEQNHASTLIRDYQKQHPELSHNAFFDEIDEALDGEGRFADSVANNEVVLSIVFSHSGFTKGQLGAPLTYSSETDQFIDTMPTMSGYITNTPRLSAAANYTGFINAHPDPDGIMRRARLVQRFGDTIYPSLSLSSSMAFLLADEATLHSDRIGNKQYLSAVQLFEQIIPVDSKGDVLIPYLGPAYTFTYVSAVDVLEGTADSSLLEGKVILVGSTASSLSDFRATPTNHLYPGVEAHANVITGIINNQFYAQPDWSHGINFVLILVGGGLLSLLLPFLSPFRQLALVSVLILGIAAFDYWLWSNEKFVIESVVPILTLLLLGIFNMAYGFVINSRDRLQLKSMFGQYVPPELVDQMSKDPAQFAMDGQRKEMSVLFADIRNFTSISEGLSATELKQWLNEYFTPITEIIFQNQGTIDKYVGDMVMAFWGAPLDDPEHASHAILAAQAMQAKTLELNKHFKATDKPPVEIGIGISSGDMNVGNMGSQYRRSYTVLGDTVNLGSRLEGLTKFYGAAIIVSSRTKALIGQQINFRHLDRVRVKGKAKPIDIFEPLQQFDAAELAVYHKALGFYLEGDFEKSLPVFKTLKDNNPDTILYRLYVERCESLKKNPPANWQGVFIHTTK
ncbi:MAG: adenylate/guanylate cyclase domain-containing protein [Candidatus Pelagadaptatus aseana]|uniref:CHASE2 domain-containing protein n=1 Tax=Candidatus Pelagadaptatus aseana TaxID=3120508 RepID=UPI0039B2FC26